MTERQAMSSSQHRITAKRATSKFAGEHLLLFLDDEPLDVLLVKLTQQDYLDGLIPTLLGWQDERETALVLERIVPPPGGTTRPPVLMCPDDADFSCTTIVVEAVGHPEYVEWRRIGLDQTPDRAVTSRVGESVDWFDGVGPFRFAREEYEAVVAAFAHETTMI